MTYYKATRPDGTSFYDGKTAWADEQDGASVYHKEGE